MSPKVNEIGRGLAHAQSVTIAFQCDEQSTQIIDMEEPFIEEEQEFQLEQRLLSATDITLARPSSKRKVRLLR